MAAAVEEDVESCDSGGDEITAHPPPHSLPHHRISPQNLPPPPPHHTPPPFAAVDAPEKVVELGDQISNLTFADTQKLVEYLQDKLGVSAASFAPFDVVIDDVQATQGSRRLRWLGL
ncbi:hypothetical protein SASPL_133569 [Salvia splendens]|uniref:Large ribosomal subunit protein bL12 oligomerization domain-containing protein n=1 Tax=Salvia splendens TaxID=180675 RepID=A0A8X8ZIL2_SALSN|nr:hypothetical protein SASPL_133569 [Salvia splendens]